MARRIPRPLADRVPRRPPRHAVSSADQLAHVRAAIASDRAKGTTLWQVVVAVPGETETRVAITSDPERFLVRLHDGHVDVPGLARGVACVVGTFVFPVVLTDLSERDLAAVVTLPRDTVLSVAQVAAHGIPVEVREVADDYWSDVGWR